MESFHEASQIQDVQGRAEHASREVPCRASESQDLFRLLESGEGCSPAIGGRTEAVLWRESAATRLEWRQRGLLLQHMKDCSA